MTVANSFFGFLLILPTIYSLSAIGRATENGISFQDVEPLLLTAAVLAWIALTATMWLGSLFRALERTFFLRRKLFWSLHCLSEALWVVFLSLGLFNSKIEYDRMEIGYVILGLKLLSALASGLFIRLDRTEVDPGGGINSVPLRSTT